MNYVGGLLLAVAIAITAAGPAQAGLRSERASTAAPFKKTAAKKKSTADNISASTHSPQAAKGGTGKSHLHQLVGKHARAAGVPVRLALAVVQVESNFNPRARGRAGEVGLMQIKPATARLIGYKGSVKALYNPDTNLAWGMKYLAEAHRRGGGSVCGTILKYNAGHHAKRMNKISSRYCRKVKSILGKPA
ncbi:MAG: transglycosylase SLT domain-containing protein [Hyphomicrobiales bacterium]|nr:transglycosylase SLT domain-containing protein [Hyphomicrobiales bacterium]